MNINPFDILKSAQKIQEQMGSFQEKLGRICVTGLSGGGMVEVDLNGKMEITAVRISAEAVDPDDIPMLEDLITAAFSSALEKIKERVRGEMGMFAGGMGISGVPGLFG